MPIVLKSGSLSHLEPLGLFQVCTGIALPFTKYFVSSTNHVALHYAVFSSSFVLNVKPQYLPQDCVIGYPHRDVARTRRLSPLQMNWHEKCLSVFFEDVFFDGSFESAGPSCVVLSDSFLCPLADISSVGRFGR